MSSEKDIERALGDIEVLKKDLDELRADLAAGIKQNRESILEVRRAIATQQINSDVKDIREIISTQLPQKSHLITQLYVDAKEAKSNINASPQPLKLSTEFHDKWLKVLVESKANIVVT